ncbi:hypothetical protein ACFV6U_00135, partial [Streptomyces sp. NPDC059810]
APRGGARRAPAPRARPAVTPRPRPGGPPPPPALYTRHGYDEIPAYCTGPYMDIWYGKDL